MILKSLAYNPVPLDFKLLLTLNEHARKPESVNFVKSLSPVAWEHINFFGWYDFNESRSLVDTEKLARSINTNFLMANGDL